MQYSIESCCPLRVGPQGAVARSIESVCPKVGPGTGGVGPTNFGISYGSISFDQLSGYIVFCILLIGGASPPV